MLEFDFLVIIREIKSKDCMVLGFFDGHRGEVELFDDLLLLVLAVWIINADFNCNALVFAGAQTGRHITCNSWLMLDEGAVVLLACNTRDVV